jgi:hypothetical protein
MSILNPTPQEIEDEKIRTYRDYWNPPPTAITSPTIEELHNDLNDLIKQREEQSLVEKTAYEERHKRKTFVAGNYAEYKAWLIRKGYSKTEYVYVASANNLRGISAEDLKGIYIGTWRNRTDIDQIRQMIAFIKAKSSVTPVTGQIGTAIYYDHNRYTIGSSISGSSVTTEEIIRGEVRSKIRVEVREKLHDEIVKLGYGDATRVYPILAAIDSVLDEYCSGILKGENYAELVL